jgi:CCR4-NOT transcription complex subunit 1
LHKLLLSLFKFLSPFLLTADLQAGGLDLYRGTLRILLVLLHDCPEFLSEYYYSLCDAIPVRCIQMRNVILSAFPSWVVPPDPHLAVDALPTETHSSAVPPILSDYLAALKNADVLDILEHLLSNRGTSAILAALKERLVASSPETGDDAHYNLPVLNALVLYVGISAVSRAEAKTGGLLFDSVDPSVAVLKYLILEFDPEGQFDCPCIRGPKADHP